MATMATVFKQSIDQSILLVVLCNLIGYAPSAFAKMRDKTQNIRSFCEDCVHHLFSELGATKEVSFMPFTAHNLSGTYTSGKPENSSFMLEECLQE